VTFFVSVSIDVAINSWHWYRKSSQMASKGNKTDGRPTSSSEMLPCISHVLCYGQWCS